MSVQDTLFCYIRVSSDRQEKDGSSLDVQHDMGIKVSKKLNMKPDVTTYNEGSRSSIIHYREKLEQLKEDIKSNKIKYIWVQDRSRLFRDMVEGVTFRSDYLERYKVILYEGVTPNRIEFNSEDERLMYDIITRIQQSENIKRSEKSRYGKLRKLQKESHNKPVFLGGTPLYGYKSVDKLWVIDKDESKIVKYIFDQYEKGKSTRDIKIELDKQGVQPRRTSNGLWNIGTLVTMLKNKSYTGLHSVNEYRVLDIDRITKKKHREIVRTYNYKIPKIINVGQFNKVQKIIESNNKQSSNSRKHYSLLDTFLFCECGLNMGSQVKELTTKHGQKVNTRKYFCRSNEYTWKSNVESDCKNKKSMNMELTNSYVIDYVKSTVQKSSILKDKFKNEVMSQKKSSDQDIKTRTKKLESQHSSNQKQIDDIENSIVDLEVKKVTGEIPENRCLEIIDRLEKHLTNLKEKNLEVEVEIEKIQSEKSWLDWVSKYGEDIKLKTSDEVKQKEFLQGIIEKIVVNSDYGIVRNNDVQIGHSLSFHFKLKIVDDNLIYKNKDKKSEGYSIVQGKYFGVGEPQKFITPRKKKIKI